MPLPDAEMTDNATVAPDTVADAPVRPIPDQQPGSQTAARAPLPDGHAVPTNPPPVTAVAPIRVEVLGALRITARGSEIVTGLRSSSRELLAYLALHPEGASGETLAEELWPDRPPQPDNSHLHTALKSLRARLRSATGARNAMFVVHVAGRYRVDDTLVASDITDFRAALTAAAASGTDPAEQIRHLNRAALLYRGSLLDGSPYEWPEPQRERLRRNSSDALTRLATLLQPNQPDQALAVLDRALELDPYNEELYRQIMAAQASTGRLDAVTRTLRLLERRLDDLGVAPSETTRIWHSRLTARVSPDASAR